MTDLPLAERSVDLVRAWIDSDRESSSRSDPAAERLAHLLQDPDGLDFTVGFVDRVIRPEDSRVAAHNLRSLARSVPKFLPFQQRLLLKVGAMLSLLLPGFVVGQARRTLRRLVGHLLIDARPAKLGRAIARLRKGGDRLNINLLGEAVLGEQEAVRRRDRTLALLERDDVDYVSVKVSAVASQLSMWAFDDTVDRVVERLQPLYTAASANGAFINLDMEEYRDLDLTIAVFTKVLEDFPDLKAGIVLQAYLPDCLAAMQQLQEWATARRALGGARIKVRVVKGANLAMELVDAAVHGWPLATWSTKQETDTNYKRVLDWAFTPERIEAVHIGVAGQNLFDIAYAWLLADQRSVRDGIEFEMLLGMDTGPMDAVRGDVGQLLLYTPVVHPEEFDVAISYLVRRLEENASSENFMSAAFDLATSSDAFDREANRFLDSVKALDESVPEPFRSQDRTSEHITLHTDGFSNAADTDPSTDANRRWGQLTLQRSTYSHLGMDTVEAGSVHGPASLQTLIYETREAGSAWAARGVELRSWILHQAGAAIAARRGDLVAIMAAETGKTIAEADVEVSEAIDFAHYYAESALRLDAVDGARFEPATLTVVTPPWNFPVAIPAGSVLSALAAGSGVIIKPAHLSRRSAAVMVEALWQGGIPREALRFITIAEGSLSQELISHPGVDRVILTGGWDTAKLFRSWRPDLGLLAETSGKNAMVVTPSADLDLAVADLAKSAFGHAGQKCSAASLAILVGSVATSDRFNRQLLDAVSSLVVGYPDDPTTMMSPIIEPAHGKLLSALTTLQAGESWLLEPKRLDSTGRLWSPGIRTGVQPGSEFHTTEYFGPVLGIMHAHDLDEAIRWQNATDFGLTAGLHSLDPDEVNVWVDRVEAGNLYINRGITGAIVQRQPFGGWKRSTVGTTSKAGGPNYLTHLGVWHPRPLRTLPPGVTLSKRIESMLTSVEGSLGAPEIAGLRAAATSDQIAWTREFGIEKDVSRLGVERNVFRYRPVPVMVRCDGSISDLVRVLLAAARAGSPVTVSSAIPLPRGLADHVVETHEAWRARMSKHHPERVRVVGSPGADLSHAVDGDPDVAIYAGPVTQSGRIELLPFLREQAISITNHRFGNPDRAFEAVLPRA